MYAVDCSMNGQSVAKVDNQHRAYWIDVSSAIHGGSNTVVVAFANPAAFVILEVFDL